MISVTAGGEAGLFLEELNEIVDILETALVGDVLYGLGCELKQVNTSFDPLLIDIVCEGGAYFLME